MENGQWDLTDSIRPTSDVTLGHSYAMQIIAS